MNELYLSESQSFFTVVLCMRESISVQVPSSPMELSRKLSTFIAMVSESISKCLSSLYKANPLAPFYFNWIEPQAQFL